MFFNLYDCVLGSASFYSYILSVFFFMGAFLWLILSTGYFSVIVVLVVTATITMISDTYTNNISYASIFYILAIYLNRDLRLRIVLYFTNLVIIICFVVYNYINIGDFINYIIGYMIVYSLSELVYLDIKRGDK